MCDEKRVEEEEEEWMRIVFTSSPSPLPVCVASVLWSVCGGDVERVQKQGKCSDPAGVPSPARHPSAVQPMAPQGERQRLKKAGKTQRNSDMPFSQPESKALAIFP